MQSRMSHQLAVTWKRVCGIEPNQSGGPLDGVAFWKAAGAWRAPVTYFAYNLYGVR